MTEKQRLKLIKKFAEKGKKKKMRASKKVVTDYVALEPTAPTENDIREEYDNLTRYTANQYINYEE